MNQECASTEIDLDVSDAGVPLYALDRPDEHFPAYLCQRNGDYLLFRVREDLAVGRQLVTVDAGLRTEIEVVYRQKRPDGAFDIGCKKIAAEKGTIRKEWRMPVDLPATVTLNGSEVSYKGRVLNMSTAGLGLQLPTEVTPGSEIVVRMNDGIGFGEVRHCRRVNKDTYVVGVFMHKYVESDQSGNKGKKNFTSGWLAQVSRRLRALRFWAPK